MTDDQLLQLLRGLALLLLIGTGLLATSRQRSPYARWLRRGAVAVYAAAVAYALFLVALWAIEG